MMSKKRTIQMRLELTDGRRRRRADRPVLGESTRTFSSASLVARVSSVTLQRLAATPRGEVLGAAA
jgi:hypothetical protein